MDQKELEKIEITLKYFPKLYFHVFSALRENDVSMLRNISTDRAAKYLAVKILYEFIIMLSQEKKYTDIIKKIQECKADENNSNSSYFSLTDGNFIISKANQASICQQIDDISTTFGLIMIEDKIFDNDELLSLSLGFLYNILDDFIKIHDHENTELSTYNFVEIMLTKSLLNFIQSYKNLEQDYINNI